MFVFTTGSVVSSSVRVLDFVGRVQPSHPTPTARLDLPACVPTHAEASLVTHHAAPIVPSPVAMPPFDTSRNKLPSASGIEVKRITTSPGFYCEGITSQTTAGSPATRSRAESLVFACRPSWRTSAHPEVRAGRGSSLCVFLPKLI